MQKYTRISLFMMMLLKHTIITPMEQMSELLSIKNPNVCLIPTNDHAEYITQLPGWPHTSSILTAKSDGKEFKKIWLSHKKNKQNNFLLGLSSSAYQFEGGLDKNNATADFYITQGLPTAKQAIDFWNRYEDDIQQMKNELGINAFRLSIAWDRVQPTPTTYDENAIATYLHMIQICKLHKIEPIVTLHQYTIPTWFATMGGFEKKENNVYFIEFAKKIYNTLRNDVIYWSTFNAPEAYAIKGYAGGENSPGIKNNWQKVEEVLINMLDAHVGVYQAIKGPEGIYNKYKNNAAIPNPQIGIQKNILLLDSANKTFEQTCLSPVTSVCCKAGNILQNDVFYSFFKTGVVNIWIPSKVNLSHTNTLAQKSLDWIGINFYSNMFMHKMNPIEETDQERKTENPRYRVYPEGIARAIEQIHTNIAQPLNIPIIITENGIATPNNSAGEEKRQLFFHRALFTIQTLIQHGYNIIGYLPWSSHDCFEWPTKEFPDAFTTRLFGFFSVNPITYQRTLKHSSYYYRDFIKGYNAQ